MGMDGERNRERRERTTGRNGWVEERMDGSQEREGKESRPRRERSRRRN
jgi:hypothetical protein